MQFLSRRVYENIFTVLGEGQTNDNIMLPEKYFLVYASFLVKEDESEVEFNKWYNEEHVPIIAKVDGYIRGRRFKLVSEFGRGEAEGQSVGQYVAVYEFANEGVLGDEQFKIARSTPWRAEIMEKAVVSVDLRMFALDRAFKKPLA